MEIIHHISIASSGEVRRELATMGVIVGAGEPLAGNIVTFGVSESNENWATLEAWLARRGAVDTVTTTFSKREIGLARWLEVQPDWHWSYPQPEDEYQSATYDLSEYCGVCGIGARQKAPFRMRSEPQWGRRGILQLNWVFDEYFVTPEVWSHVLKPLGILVGQVVDARGAELKTVLQLVPSQSVGIVTDGLIAQVCGRCGRQKFLPVARGPFPALRTEPPGPLARSEEYFGSGASAHHAVLVSRAVADVLAPVRGISFRPVQTLEDTDARTSATGE